VRDHLDFPVWTTTLDNGIRVWVNPRPGHGSMVASIVVRGGARYEPPGKSGVAHLTEHMVFTGAADRTEDDIVRFVRERGGYRNGHTMPERVYYYAQLGPEWLDDSVDWLSDVVFRPTFDADKLPKELNVVHQEQGGRELPAVARIRDRVATRRLIDAMRSAYFPGSPMAFDPAGHPATLPNVTIDDVRAFHAAHYRPTDAVLIVVGDVTPDAVLRVAEHRLGGLAPGEHVPTPPPPPTTRWPGEVAWVRAPRLSDACSVVLAAPVMGRDDANIWATDLLAEYLMDQSWTDLRIRRGLVYKLWSRNWFHSNTGLFQLETEGECGDTAAIGDALNQAVDRVIAGDVDAERLAVVQQMYVGQWRVRMEPNLGRVEWLSRWALPDGDPLSHADGPRRVAALTPVDLSRTARDWLGPDRRTLWVHTPLIGRSWVAGAVLAALLLLLALLARRVSRGRA
jgi:zinc protease